MSSEYLLWLQSYFNELRHTPILESFLGLELTMIAQGRVEMRMLTEQRHCNFYGYTHGGTLSSLSDIAMGLACITQGKKVVTIDMSVSYIKNAPAGSVLTATGIVIGDGRTILRATGEIHHGEQLLVRSQASYYATGEFSQSEGPPV